jgi:hypothetical protein
MILLRLIKEGEIRLAAVVLVLLSLLAASTSLAVGIELLTITGNFPDQGSSQLDLVRLDAVDKGWPSTTPHQMPWPAPDRWLRQTLVGRWYYSVDAHDPDRPGYSLFSMRVLQAGWPFPVIERKQMWWDWNDPNLKGPESAPRFKILWGWLALSVVVFAGGLWLIVFAPLALWTLMIRFERVLRGQCAICGSDRMGCDKCPECRWQLSKVVDTR